MVTLPPVSSRIVMVEDFADSLAKISRSGLTTFNLCGGRGEEAAGTFYFEIVGGLRAPDTARLPCRAERVAFFFAKYMV